MSRYEHHRAVSFYNTNSVEAAPGGYRGRVVGKQKLPALPSVEDPSMPGIPLLDADGRTIPHPSCWFTEAIHPAGHRVSYPVTNGSAQIPVRPLFHAERNSYQAERLTKAYAAGFLLPELGCLVKQRTMTRQYGIKLVRDTRIVARELLDPARPECVGECVCFDVEIDARRERHTAAQRASADAIEAMDPRKKTDDAIALLANAVAGLVTAQKPDAKKRGKS